MLKYPINLFHIQYICSTNLRPQINIPCQTEDEEACLAAIISLPHSHTFPKPSGSVNFNKYYEEN